MTSRITFRDYERVDCASCLSLFDENSPEFFAENEKRDFERFLSGCPRDYQVALIASSIVAAYGLSLDPERERGRISWIMVSPRVHGQGVGARMMNRAINHARRVHIDVIDIAASHLSAPFFARFGAVEAGTTPHGWGADMHRIDMELTL